MINKLLCALGVLCVALVAFAQTPDQRSADKLPELNRFDPAIANDAKDPCTDFYAFACSKWQEANPIPEDQFSWGTTSNLNLWNQTLLRQTMDSLAKADAKRNPVEQRVGDYWQSCMDESAIESLGVKAIQSDLDRIAAIKNAKQIAQIVAGMHGMFPGAYEMDTNYAAAPILGFYPRRSWAFIRCKIWRMRLSSSRPSTRAEWECRGATTISPTRRSWWKRGRSTRSIFARCSSWRETQPNEQRQTLTLS
jgi:endothelin-converting enzyme/putative endopeptidase